MGICSIISFLIQFLVLFCLKIEKLIIQHFFTISVVHKFITWNPIHYTERMFLLTGKSCVWVGIYKLSCFLEGYTTTLFYIHTVSLFKEIFILWIAETTAKFLISTLWHLQKKYAGKGRSVTDNLSTYYQMPTLRSRIKYSLSSKLIEHEKIKITSSFQSWFPIKNSEPLTN